jgi:uncharacterized protein (TIGR02444 family)
LQLALDNPLWAFSLAVYPEPGVSEECIALQDARGIDVNLLLFCAYAGGMRGVALSADEVQDAAATVANWHAGVIRPLREVRRALKPIENAPAQQLRGNVKKDELLAEQIEQALLWGWCREKLAARPRGDRAAALAANIAAMLGGPAAPNLVRAALRQAAKI